MAKRITSLPLALPPRPARVAATRWLYEAIRGLVLDGRLRPGQALPATRDLARQVQLARGTVVSAFEQLQAEGYLTAAVGSGTRVSAVLPEQLLEAFRGRSATASGRPRTPRPGRRTPVVAPPPPTQVSLSSFGAEVTLLRGDVPRPPRAFRANEPALDQFPLDLWARVAARRLRRASAGLLRGCEPAGFLPLREAVADYLNASRGLACGADQVLIVSGIQEALDLTARLLLRRGDRVVVEDPGYPGACSVLAAHGATIVAAPVSADGIGVDPARWRGARLAYLTPAHQYPLGVTLSLARRLELLDWASSSGALLFEDDYDGEYRYSGRPVPALQGIDRHGVVCFAGSFSKVLFPSLRLGYLVVPAALVDRFAAAKSVLTRHAPLLDQVVLCDFLAEGHFGRHLRRMRELYAERLAVLSTASRHRLAGLLELSPIEAGLQTVGWLADGISAEAAELAARHRGVEALALDRFARLPLARQGLQLGFAATDEREIRRGVEQLAVALEGLARAVD